MENISHLISVIRSWLIWNCSGKKEYLHKTWRQPKGDVLAYQIRQSFKPGEITPEEANQVGYETGMRFTKGKHAFIVATHVDRAHIHNHIIFNSTNLECDRKFRDFWFSGIALQRLSDIICLEHGLSVIPRVKPSERTAKNKVPGTCEHEGCYPGRYSAMPGSEADRF